MTKNIHMCYIGVTEGKIEKEGKMSFSIFIFIYTIHLAYLRVYTKFENTGSIGAEASMTFRRKPFRRMRLSV